MVANGVKCRLSTLLFHYLIESIDWTAVFLTTISQVLPVEEPWILIVRETVSEKYLWKGCNWIRTASHRESRTDPNPCVFDVILLPKPPRVATDRASKLVQYPLSSQFPILFAYKHLLWRLIWGLKNVEWDIRSLLRSTKARNLGGVFNMVSVEFHCLARTAIELPSRVVEIDTSRASIHYHVLSYLPTTLSDAVGDDFLSGGPADTALRQLIPICVRLEKEHMWKEPRWFSKLKIKHLFCSGARYEPVTLQQEIASSRRRTVTSEGTRFLSRTDYALTESSTPFPGVESCSDKDEAALDLEFPMFDNRRVET